MKSQNTLIILIFTFLSLQSMCFSQIKSTTNVWAAKEFSKDVALYRAKSFLYREILGVNENVSKFEIIPLAAASSGELTTLLYSSKEKNKEGLILGFFGDYWNQSGVVYQGYSFKNLNKQEAIEFLNKIDNAIKEHGNYLKQDNDNNNIYFSYKDIDVVIFGVPKSYAIRLFWNNFDSSWEKTAFDRSKRRFEKNTN